MKKSFRQSLVGILAFLTFAGLGFAQDPTVTFNPPSGTAVKSGTVVSFAIENAFTDSYGDQQVTCYWTSGASLDALDNPNMDGSSVTASGTFTVSQEKKAIKVAIVVREGSPNGDDEYLDNILYEYVLKCFTAVYTIDENAGDIELPKAASPTFSVEPGAVLDSTRIELLPRGDKIFFALGSKEVKPTEYTEYNRILTPIFITKDTTIYAYREEDGHTNSDTVSATYILKSNAPTFSPTPASGYVAIGTLVSINAAAGADIFYATGSNKLTTYTKYTTPLTISQDTTIYAYVVESGKVTSDTASISYKIISGKLAMPYMAIDPDGFRITANDTTVYIDQYDEIFIQSTVEETKIYYTLDGSNPALNEDGTTQGTTQQYKFSISFDDYYTNAGDFLTVKAFAAQEGIENSDIITVTFRELKDRPVEKPEAPVFTPKGGTVLPNTSVVIAKGTADSIFWKAGESATAAFTKSLEDVSVTITENTVLCAFAMKDGLSSDTAKVSYKVPAGPTDPTKATVRLVVNGENSIYADRNQYQILLDATHTITNDFKTDLETGNAFPESLLPRLYGDKTSTVPAGITAENATTSGVYPDNEDAVLVEPGTYDIFLLQSFDASWLNKDIVRGIYKGYDGIAGNKYFSLDDMTLEAGKSYVFNVTLDGSGAHGELLVSVDLQLSHILGENKPSCELDSVALSLAIKNIGLTTVSQYIAYCTNGKDTVKETVNNAIEAGESAVYAFTKKLELKDGQNTVIKAGIIVENETITTNNTAEYVVFRSEAGTLPLEIAPAKMLSAYAGDWSIDEENNALVAARNATTPIFSSCFRVEETGKYRLSYGYICGRYVELPDGTVLVNNVDMYEVRVGKTSLPYESWQVVETDETITGSSNYNEFTPKDIVFDITESGDYAFCIVPKRVNDQDNLKFRGITVEKMQAHAARINAFTVNSPRIVPQDWGNANYATNVVVENRGLEKLENATLSFKVNGEEATKETFSLNLNETKTFTVNVPVEGFKKNDKFKISAEILTNSNVIGTANATPAEITVSDNTAAFDHLTDFSYFRTMDGYAGGLVGIIFPVVKKDTLTGISCAWGEMTENTDISIAIHKVSVSGNEVSMGDKLHEAVVRRGVSSGLTTYETPAFLLEPGNYFISVEQIGRLGFALALDEHPEGGLHAYDKTEKSWRYLTNGGYPVIRAVFGSDGVLTTKDAAITAISKPIAGGIFANNEPIVVSVRNNGPETASIPVYVRVDNTLLESKSVSVEAYTTQEVSFTADLAATNQNRNITITAFTAMEGDEDRSNDTLRKNVLSMVPADPYRMDFESCLDFATEGLNPAWTSVSLDNSPVMPLRHVLEDYTFQYIEFPGCETDLGFITFNPLTTEPSMVLFDYYNECRSHSGQRFGVSLAITDENSPKNDWLISPKLKMPSKNTQLSMWVKSFDRVYKESYEIWVSEGSNDPASGDFVCLYPGEDEELIAPTAWTQVVFDLGQYNGKDIHVAIRCNSADAHIFMIDDIVIGENVSNEEEQQADFRLTVYPNPAKEMVSLLSPDADITSVAIFNLSGNMVHQASRLHTDNYRFNASGLTSGMYFVRVSTDKGIAIRKFVIR